MNRVDDLRAIREVIALYADGCRYGDVAKLKEAFHEDARMYGTVNGERADMPITQMADMVMNQPTGDSHRDEIMSIRQDGDVASVVLAEDGFWGMSFVDHFALCRLDGRWVIVNKVFEQTA
jgi:hypothetical protein